MKRFVVLASLILFLGLSAVASAQQKLKDAFRLWQDPVDAIRARDKEEFERIAKDLQREKERMRPLWLMLEAGILQDENQFREAASKLEKGIDELEKKDMEKQAPRETRIYREALLQMSLTYAVMGDQEKACARARQAWAVHERLLSATLFAQPADRIDTSRTSLAVAYVLFNGDHFSESGRYLQRAFDACEHLPESFRQAERNPLLAAAWLQKSMLDSRADKYPAALDSGKRAEAGFRSLYPPNIPAEGNLKLSAALINLASVHVAQGKLVEAWPLLNEVDKLLALHAPHKGIFLRAELYRLRGHMHLQRREASLAKENIDKAREIYENLFSKFPNGHPLLIQALCSSADLFNRYGKRDEAIHYARSASEQCKKRYSRAHEQYVATLLCYGRCLRDAGRIAEAHNQFTKALAMARELQGTIPTSLNSLRVALVEIHLGSLLGRQGKYGTAQELLRDAEAIYRKFSPDGHPHWLTTAAYRGIMSLHLKDRHGACEAFATALDLDRRQLRHFARTASEIEALTFNEPRQLVLHGYLCASQDNPELDKTAFDLVWTAFSAVTRLAEARRAALRLESEKNVAARQLMAKYGEVCARLRRDQLTAHGDIAPDLRKEMDGLDQQLSKFWPEAEKRFNEMEKGPLELATRLPRGSAFIQFTRYNDFTQPRIVRPRYVAFLLIPGQAARRIELGLAQEIDPVIDQWRKSVDQWNPLAPAAGRDWEKESETHSATLCDRIWKPIAEHLPADTRLLLLAPDGNLARFPFAALPGTRPQSILLEDYSIAYVPHGPFLLERLLHKEESGGRPEHFLAVGGIDYGRPRNEKYHDFKLLPGSLGIVELGKARAATGAVCVLTGGEATVCRLGPELSAASESHVSTHCFFEETAWNKDRDREEQIFLNWTPSGEVPVDRVGLGQRFPLTYVGIVLAGINEFKKANDGILNGEAIAVLPLSGLRLSFLDGCETGLGKHTAGEGVQALARAFHLAGCPNVIATLWHVNDGAARALTKEFYHQLWQNRLPTLEALRQAQLTLFHHPDRVNLLADNRGAPTGRQSEGLEIHLPSPISRASLRSVQIWGAAYVHSGIGHPLMAPAALDELLSRLQETEAANPSENFVAGSVPESGSTVLLRWILSGTAAFLIIGVLLVYRQRQSAGFRS